MKECLYKNCKNLFDDTDPRKLYCSRECKEKDRALRKFNRAKLARLALKPITTCRYCKKDFSTKFIGQTYCSIPCRQAAKKEYRKKVIGGYRTQYSRYLRDLKLKSVCADCSVPGFPYPEILDFHHVRGTKKFQITSAVATSKFKLHPEEVQEEMDKCVIVCANCHRIRHAKSLVVGGEQ